MRRVRSQILALVQNPQRPTATYVGKHSLRNELGFDFVQKFESNVHPLWRIDLMDKQSHEENNQCYTV